jgi:hypothetical protein
MVEERYRDGDGDEDAVVPTVLERNRSQIYM